MLTILATLAAHATIDRIDNGIAALETTQGHIVYAPVECLGATDINGSDIREGSTVAIPLACESFDQGQVM